MKWVAEGQESNGKSLMLARKMREIMYRNASWYKKTGVPRPILRNMPFSKRFVEEAHKQNVPIQKWRQLAEIVGVRETDIVIDEFTITPLDTCKDIVVNGISYRNVVLRHINTKDNSLHKQDIKVSKIEDKQQTTKVEVKEKKKEIKKVSNPFGYLIIIAIIIVLWLNKRWFLYLP